MKKDKQRSKTRYPLSLRRLFRLAMFLLPIPVITTIFIHINYEPDPTLYNQKHTLKKTKKIKMAVESPLPETSIKKSNVTTNTMTYSTGSVTVEIPETIIPEKDFLYDIQKLVG